MGGVSGAEIILLCEDSQHDSFVRRFLRNRKFRGRDIQTLPLSDGSGSGEQWVRNRFPNELQAIRSKRGAYLIVVLDADNQTVDDRLRQLDAECENKGVKPRREDDPLIVIIPRRNIETWLANFDGSDVDETKKYPKLAKESDCVRHAKALHEMCDKNRKLREPIPPSLLVACDEYRKLKR